MDAIRQVYEWTRAIFAVFGAIGCLLLVSIAVVVFRLDHPPDPDPPPPARADPLDDAAGLLNEAGVDRDQTPLTVEGYDPGSWRKRDNSNIQLYCLQASGLHAGARWLPSAQLKPAFVESARLTLEAAHADNDCVPDWNEVVSRQLKIQPLQFVYSQQQLGFAQLALYEPEAQRLYLISRTTPTSPPDSQAADSAPSTE